MKEMIADNFLVKIKSGSQQASGFLHVPDPDNKMVYVITARHVFETNNGSIFTDEIQIQFNDTDKLLYAVSANDKIVLGANSETEDYAIIILPKDKIPESIANAKLPALALIAGNEKSCIVTGYPKVTNNESQRSLFKVELLKDSNFKGQIQLELSDPISEPYNTGDLVEGYSGSPVMVESGLDLFIVGMFLAYEDPTKRILGLDLVKISDKLKENGFPALILRFIETDVQILADISKLRSNSKRVLNRINNKIGKIELKRSEVVDEIENLVLNNSFVLVSGDAGIGKSSATREAVAALMADFEIIALQGEQLDKANMNEIFKEPALHIQNEFEKLLDSHGMKPKKILLIDSIEKLLETANADTIVDFFNLLKTRSDIKIVLTCRSYAVEQLKIRFLQKFLPIKPYKVPTLTDDELLIIIKEYPFLASLLNKPSLNKVLKIPFNIDKATLVGDEVTSTGLDSESDFKRIVWEYIIENRQKEANSVIRQQRGHVFQRISLERAKRMVPYVPVTLIANMPIIQLLLQDNLIEKDPTNKDACAASHDIYEDWALTRFIDANFATSITFAGNITAFFAAIGYAPAIRRAFRIWVAEKIQNIDYNAEEFLQRSLKERSIDHYWKDEILIAIMQSSYCEDFLARSKDILFDENFELFNRATLLLSVACQEPDLNYINLLKEDERKHLYKSYLLKPVGPGWASMIRFIFAHLDDLPEHFHVIMPVIFQWAKTIDVFNNLPTESELVAGVILKYFDAYLNPDEERKIKGKNAANEAISLLFKLTAVAKDQVRNLIEKALSFDKEVAEYHQRNFYGSVIDKVLSWSDSAQLSSHLPYLVIKVAEKEWFYFPPFDEEGEEEDENSIIRHLARHNEKDEQFGVVSEYKREYFPPSGYQTPIGQLLWSDQNSTISFICRLFNHSAEAFWNSDFLLNDSDVFRADKRFEVSYTLPEGDIIKQKGALVLWLTYRGTYVANPYLLQSVLMALEAWLLQLCKLIESDKEEKYPLLRNRLDKAFDQLLRESNSVATTAVLISIALAHPKITFGKILPLLKVKEFYNWDFERRFYDPRALAMAGSGDIGYLLQKERMASNQLPHRKSDLQQLVLKMSFEGYEQEILKLLDDFYNESPLDDHWRIVLNRMDKRKLEVVDIVEKGYLVQTKFDDDLKPIIEASASQLNEISSPNAATLWARNKLENKPVENDGVEEWKRHYNEIRDFTPRFPQSKLYHNPGLLAAVGIRFYYNFLSESESNWCVDKVFEIINYEINKGMREVPIDFNMPFGALELDAACTVLPDLIMYATGKIREDAKELFFACLLFVHDKLEREAMINRFKEVMWTNASGFAAACVKGLIEYSKITWLRQQAIHEIRRNQYANNKESRTQPKKSFCQKISGLFGNLFNGGKKIKDTNKDEDAVSPLIEEYNNKLIQIVNSVISETNSFSSIPLDDKHISEYYLFEAMLLVPENTAVVELHDYYTNMLHYIFRHLDSENLYGDEKIHYELLQKFEQHFAEFLLEQPAGIAMEKFAALIDPIFKKGDDTKYKRKKIEFVERCLQNILSISIEKNEVNPTFWQLWNYLADKSTETGAGYFAELLLFDLQYMSSDLRDWAGLRGKQLFFKMIVENFGTLKSTAKLLSGIGYAELMPEGILWLEKMLDNSELKDSTEIHFFEKLMISVFYDKRLRTIVRDNNSLRNAFIRILGELINQRSASAFLIREDFVSRR